MAIYYLDVDDEITSAAARIRDSSDSRIALVLSGGSRVATSRINFRLLAREAKRRGKRLAIIAADSTAQSVARSAELPVYASVGDYEKSEAAMTSAMAGHAPDAVSEALYELSLTVGPPGAVGPAGGSGMARVGGGRPVNGAPRRRSMVPRALLTGFALLALVALAVAGFFFIPSASVTLTLSQKSVGPITVNVTVDPKVAAVNDQAGTVPGVSKAFPVDASGTFDATGQTVVLTAATGTVTFTSINTVSDVPVIAGTRVSTSGGVVFTTTSTVDVPKATVSINFQHFTPGRADAPVQAAKSGTVGNVPAGSIVKVPSDLVPFQITVSNASPTNGGSRTVTPQILQSDVDGAMAGLQAQLGASFQSALQSPTAVPSGSTLFAGSAQLGGASCSPDAQSVVGGTDPSFQLDCRATGTAIVADMSIVRNVAKGRIGAAISNGYSLVADSVTASSGTPVVQNSMIVIPMTVQAAEVPVVNVDELKARIKGMSVDDARSLLSKYGQVDLSVSPSWDSTISSFDFRIDIQVIAPSPRPGGSSSPTRASENPTSASPSGPEVSPVASPTPLMTESPPPQASPTDSTPTTEAPSASPTSS